MFVENLVILPKIVSSKIGIQSVIHVESVVILLQHVPRSVALVSSLVPTMPVKGLESQRAKEKKKEKAKAKVLEVSSLQNLKVKARKEKAKARKVRESSLSQSVCQKSQLTSRIVSMQGMLPNS